MAVPIRELTMIGLTRQKVGTAGVVLDHSKAAGLVEVFDLIVGQR